MPSRVNRCRSGLRKGHKLLSTDPQAARRIAEDLLDQFGDLPEMLGDVLSLLGTARRFCGDREEARSAFQSASSVEPSRLKKGHVYCQWAILETECHRYDEALRKASRGLALIESSSPRDRDRAQGLIARGMAFWHLEDYDKAEEDNRRALGLIHPKTDARLHLTAVHNLGLSLLFGSKDLHRVNRALWTLDETNRLLRRYRVPLKSMQNAMVLWTKGLTYRLVGADERGEALLKRARQIFLELKAYTEWVRVSLDLVEVYLGYERWGLVRRTLAQTLEHANDSEVVAALRIFHEAVKAEAVTDEILGKVYARVHGKQRKPPRLAAEDDDFEPIGF